jgi:quinol monooxygenase YgiN
MKTKILILSVVLIAIAVSWKPKTNQQQSAQTATVQKAELKKMITARVFIKPGREADFIAAAKVMIENSNKEEGCTFYQLFQDPYVKTNFIFVESYKNQAAVDFHFATSYFKAFGPIVTDMVSKPGEIKILDIAAEK